MGGFVSCDVIVKKRRRRSSMGGFVSCDVIVKKEEEGVVWEGL